MIKREHVTEAEVHQFVCDASDLYDACPDFRQGWPKGVPTDLGNGLPFQATSKQTNADGEIEYVEYRQLHGCISLKVFND